MAYGVHVPLTATEREKLNALARSERRYPRDQAAVLLTRALAALPEPYEDTDAPQRQHALSAISLPVTTEPIEIRS